MTAWTYIVGSARGDYIKFGRSGRDLLAPRMTELAADDPEGDAPLMLAAVRTDGFNGHAERNLLDYPAWPVKMIRRKKEYREPVEDLIQYVNWCRMQWWVSLDGLDDDLPVVDPERWSTPDIEGRRQALVEDDPDVLVQPWMDRQDHLRGTPWERMVWENEPIQDYFTPAEIVEAARSAMGGIDLDAASHYMANRVHRIPDYFTPGQKDAMTERWYGRVWLNPPYPDKGGSSKPWLDRAVGFIRSGDVTQFCMLSPIWIFHAQQARELMDLASMMVLLSPTPTFWGNKHGKTGTNHPHAILYVGPRTTEFCEAFAEHGILLEPKALGVVP